MSSDASIEAVTLTNKCIQRLTNNENKIIVKNYDELTCPVICYLF